MKKYNKEILGNFASFFGVPVSEKYHPTFVLQPLKMFPFIKVMKIDKNWGN